MSVHQVHVSITEHVAIEWMDTRVHAQLDMKGATVKQVSLRFLLNILNIYLNKKSIAQTQYTDITSLKSLQLKFD